MNVLTDEEIKDLDLIKKIEIKSNLENLELYSEDSEFTLKLRITEIEDVKELNKFIKNVESLVRKCPEYKLWTDYIHEVLNQHTCQVTGELHFQAKLDIHHHPFTLYDIVKAIIIKKSSSQKEFCSFDVALDTIKLHFEMKIGYCLLLKSIHEKYHNGFLSIPMEMVNGNYMEFYREYFQLLDDDDKDRIIEKMSVNEKTCGWNINSNYWDYSKSKEEVQEKKDS